MLFFSRISKKKKSGIVAKHRLKSILISDRSDCSSDIIDTIKEELYQTLSRYIETDIGHIHLDMISNVNETDSTTQIYLIVKIPFRGINKVIC